MINRNAGVFINELPESILLLSGTLSTSVLAGELIDTILRIDRAAPPHLAVVNTAGEGRPDRLIRPLVTLP